MDLGVRGGDDGHPGVVLDLGRRGIDHRGHGHRLALFVRHVRAGQHQQVGTVASHPRGQVVQPEQLGQPLWVLFVTLQLIDDGQLLIDQRPTAPRQRLEHVADLKLQPGLLAGEQHGLFVQLVDRVRNLPDLLGALHRQRADGHVGAGPDLVELTNQVLVGDLEGAGAQSPQRPDQRPRHVQHDEQGQHHHGADDGRIADGLGALGRGLIVDRRDDGRGHAVEHLAGDAAGGLDRLAQVGIVDERHVGVGHHRHPLDHLLGQLLRLGRADTQHFTHTEQCRRLRAGQGRHRAAQFVVRQFAAEGDEQLLHHHLTAGADGPAQTLRLGANLLVVDAYRTGDRVLGGQQERRVRRHALAQSDAVGRDLVEQPLATVEQGFDAGADIGRDVGLRQPVLQPSFALVVGAQRLLRVAAGGRGQYRGVERRHVVLDGRHHFGAVRRAAQIRGVRPARIDTHSAERAGQCQRHKGDGENFPGDRPIRRRKAGRAFRGRAGDLIGCRKLLRSSHRGSAFPPAIGPQTVTGAWFIVVFPAGLSAHSGTGNPPGNLSQYDSDEQPFPCFTSNEQRS
ncbi:Uncharacterised protein [Mycobacteroides abscessus subsp. abscessus]|nr:Uncharacterised protein [Mycobacteroides abscessus subsp. abscessus]